MTTSPASMGGPLSEADRIAEIQARLDAASSMPWEAGDVWGWAGLVWTADGTRDWNGNGTRCSYCRDSDPVDVKVRDINGEEMMAHLHRLPEPWDLDSAISDADGELVVRSVPDPADHNLILHAPVDLAYLLSRVGVLEGQLATARGAVVLGEIAAERARQDAKWGEQNHPDGTGNLSNRYDAERARKWCQDSFGAGYGTWADILAEEVAEANAERDNGLLRAELIQVAAVAVAWVEAIDRRTSAALGLDGGDPDA